MKRAFIQIPTCYKVVLQIKLARSTAFLGALWAHCAQSAPRKAVESIYYTIAFGRPKVKKDFIYQNYDINYDIIMDKILHTI